MNEQEIALSYSQPTTEQHKLKGGSGQAWGAAGGMEQGGEGAGLSQPTTEQHKLQGPIGGKKTIEQHEVEGGIVLPFSH
jgi:hypothetical protein